MEKLIYYRPIQKNDVDGFAGYFNFELGRLITTYQKNKVEELLAAEDTQNYIKFGMLNILNCISGKTIDHFRFFGEIDFSQPNLMSSLIIEKHFINHDEANRLRLNNKIWSLIYSTIENYEDILNYLSYSIDYAGIRIIDHADIGVSIFNVSFCEYGVEKAVVNWSELFVKLSEKYFDDIVGEQNVIQIQNQLDSPNVIRKELSARIIGRIPILILTYFDDVDSVQVYFKSSEKMPFLKYSDVTDGIKINLIDEIYQNSADYEYEFTFKNEDKTLTLFMNLASF